MNSARQLLQDRLKTHPVVFITRDIERALGMPPTEGYFIIAPLTEFGEKIKKERNDVLLIETEKSDTFSLLSSDVAKNFIREKGAAVMVFQNSSRIEELCRAENFPLLNPPSAISTKIEEKISQYEWLSANNLQKFLPTTEVKILKEIKYSLQGRTLRLGSQGATLETSFILQFNRAHTGEGTMLINSKEQLDEIVAKFPNRPARKSELVSGPVFTVNACVINGKTVCSNISYQITGLSQFTDNQFSTIGNDWALPYKILNEQEREKIKHIAEQVGEKLALENWRGLFGIDVVQDEKTHEIYLLEINARQPASTTCESILQLDSLQGRTLRLGSQGATLETAENLTIFEAHLMGLLSVPIENPQIQQITDGSQIVLRKKANVEIPDIQKMQENLEAKGFKVTPYENTEPNKELLRIRSEKGIMKGHGEFNEVGKIITEIIK